MLTYITQDDYVFNNWEECSIRVCCVNTINRESFAELKLSRYSHYMDFPSNTFAVQGQGTYMLYLEQKIHRKNFCALLKAAKTVKV